MIASKDLVLLHQSFSDYSTVITTLAGLALDKGLVDEDYLPAILEREKQFPTGLDLPVAIAIPHIDKGCKESFVSVTTLENPVVFKSMDNSGAVVNARIVFVFGILDPNIQLEILKKFARSFSDKEKMLSLLETKSEMELLESLNILMDGMLEIK